MNGGSVKQNLMFFSQNMVKVKAKIKVKVVPVLK
jgi:hypothetical protein